MIKIYFEITPSGNIHSFKAYDHGDDVVCAAVSALSLNCVNSIDALTEANFSCDYDSTGGFLHFQYPDAKENIPDPYTDLLLNSYRLGIESIAQEYKNHIEVYLNDTPLLLK